MTEYTTPLGRIVGGHPMDHKPATDDDGKPKINDAGQPMMVTFFYFALPKNGSTDFKQTELGRICVAEAAAAWPNGEYNAPDFAWKVIDGDSTVPLRGGKPAPNTREGWPGHWVLRLSTGIPVRCFDRERGYDPMQQLQDRNHIKCGDYGRVHLVIKANDSKQSPGLYLNPSLFSFERAGELIVTESGPSASEVFGTPATAAAPSPTPATAPPPPPPPHNPLPKRYVVNGTEYTEEQLLGFGWTPEQIATAEVRQ